MSEDINRKNRKLNVKNKILSFLAFIRNNCSRKNIEIEIMTKVNIQQTKKTDKPIEIDESALKLHKNWSYFSMEIQFNSN